jgi:neutral ceramidase
MKLAHLLQIVSLALATFAQAADLRVGTAAVDITPPDATPMAGYYHERGADGALDPLRAKAIVLEQDGVKTALVALDLVNTIRAHVEQARILIEQQTGIPAGHVMISATHSHTGPVLSTRNPRTDLFGGQNPLAIDYATRLPQFIADSVRQANDRLAPARVSTAAGVEEGLAFCRRFHMTDGTVGWNPGKLNPRILRPTAPTDDEVPVVYFDTPKGQPLATYVNFALHLDTVGGTRWSADYPFTLAECLARAKGPDMLTVFTIGCAGDINHYNVRSSMPQKGPEEAARIGTILAANVLRSYERLEPLTNSALRVSHQIVKLPVVAVTDAQLTKARDVVKRLAATGERRPAFLDQVDAFKALEVEARQGQPFEVEVQVIAVGDELAFVSLPGEIFVELGLAIKHGSPFKRTIIAELANGAIGYIPTQRAYLEGNYEVVSARVAAGSGELLVESALRQLRAHFGPQGGN